jgi:hypothetical protein
MNDIKKLECVKKLFRIMNDLGIDIYHIEMSFNSEKNSFSFGAKRIEEPINMESAIDIQIEKIMIKEKE